MLPPDQRPKPVPKTRACDWLRWSIVVFVLAMIGLHWDAESGFTGLIRFGDEFAHRRLPEVAALPVASVPGQGYDGQFYAQLAVRPDVRGASTRAALDVPAYRAQRILLPLLAHLAGKPWWVLQTFALLNVLAWLVFTRFWWEEAVVLAPQRALWVWLAGVLALGVLDSLHFSLVDLPAALLLLLGIRLVRSGRPGRASLLLAAAGLTRETALLAFPAIDDSHFLRRWLWRGLAALPAVAWFLWLRTQLPVGAGGFTGNFAWPGCALAEHLVRCSWELTHGNFDSRYVWGLIGAAGFAFQSVHVMLEARRDWSNLWLRGAVAFAVLFWVLGPFVWNGYWAVARTCLPLTLAFNLSLPSGRGFWWRFALGNACVLHAIYRLLPEM